MLLDHVAFGAELLILLLRDPHANADLLGPMDDRLDVLTLPLNVLLDARVVVADAAVLLVEQQLLLLELANHIVLIAHAALKVSALVLKLGQLRILHAQLAVDGLDVELAVTQLILAMIDGAVKFGAALIPDLRLIGRVPLDLAKSRETSLLLALHVFAAE